MFTHMFTHWCPHSLENMPRITHKLKEKLLIEIQIVRKTEAQCSFKGTLCQEEVAAKGTSLRNRCLTRTPAPLPRDEVRLEQLIRGASRERVEEGGPWPRQLRQMADVWPHVPTPHLPHNASRQLSTWPHSRLKSSFSPKRGFSV